MRTHTQRTRKAGMAAVETALILPILFTMIMGVIEGGNAAYSWLTVQKATQIGARFAATGRGDEDGTRLTQIITATEKALATLDEKAFVISIRSWPDMDASGDGIENDPGAPCHLTEVAVHYTYKPFTPLVSAILPDTIPLYGYDRKINEPWKPCD
ncbi:pilus assembly protein [Pseudodesulfovibrio sp. JC047]|uniref:TadE family protein n=1 Tax=Pseudodesulfovibrio sp. JC047 TaxID=2683199 RepID=UPI0013D67D5D|nr:TadE family protein [Pseudodesulfovibrio sp. JC047]NDV20690.1 pilus assembly protein [Pseudodesulfovibrio sp. JC047]